MPADRKPIVVLEIACGRVRDKEEMASFPALRIKAKRSDESERFCVRRHPVAAAALNFLAAVEYRTASALELATRRGGPEVLVEPMLLTGAGGLLLAAASVRTPASDARVTA